MAPVIPDRKRIKSFASEAAFEAWMASNHASRPELWLKIYKKSTGKPTVTYAQALDVALCSSGCMGSRSAPSPSSP